jgi:hypothetical protein
MKKVTRYFLFFLAITFFSCKKEIVKSDKNEIIKSDKKESVNNDDPKEIINKVGWESKFFYNKNEKDTWIQVDSMYRAVIKSYKGHKNLPDFKSIAFFYFFGAGEGVKHLKFIDTKSKKCDEFIEFYQKELIEQDFQHPCMASMILNGMQSRYKKSFVQEYAKKILEKNQKRYSFVQKELSDLSKKDNLNDEEKLDLQSSQRFMNCVEEVKKISEK